MSRNPYFIEGPALISFSGGRSSGYMLWHILASHGGKLPEDIRVVFANTGKERPETLDFVQQISERWGVPITWLEYRARSGPYLYEVVNHNSASRAGEPYDKAVRDRKSLPNPMMAFCSFELKTLTIQRWCRTELGWTDYLNVVGLRADERERMAAGLARNDGDAEAWNTYPMGDAGVTKQMVSDFWPRPDGFDLGLPRVNGKTPAGNCTLCFKKGDATLVGLMRTYPDEIAWWVDHERAATSVFRPKHTSYAALAKIAGEPDLLDFLDDDTRPCGCHD